MMLSVQSTVALALMLFVLAEYSAAMPTIDKDKARFFNNVNVSRKIKFRDFKDQCEPEGLEKLYSKELESRCSKANSEAFEFMKR